MVPDEWLETVNNVGDVLLVSVITQIGFLGYFITSLTSGRKGLYFDIKNWPGDVKQRIIKVYQYIALVLSILITTSTWLCHSPAMARFIESHSFLCSISTTLGLFLSMIFLHNFSYKEKYGPKLFFFIMHGMLSAPSLCTLGIQVCAKALLYLLQMLAVVTALALLSDKDFHRVLVGPLSKMNGVVLASSICVSIIGTPRNWFEITLLCINIHVGLVFFSWMYVVNTQILMIHSKEESDNFDPIYIAAIMQINILNLYMRLATLTALNHAYLNYIKRNK